MSAARRGVQGRLGQALEHTQGFVEEVQKGPANAKPALTLLATLYGLTRLERRMAFYLAAGLPHRHMLWHHYRIGTSHVLRPSAAADLPACSTIKRHQPNGRAPHRRLLCRRCRWRPCSSCARGCERGLHSAVVGRGLGRSAPGGGLRHIRPLPAGAHRL